MRGINRVIISGNVSDSMRYRKTDSGSSCGTFRMACDRRGATRGEVVTAWIKVNVYGGALVEICKSRLRCGSYVIVEGELMNREGTQGEITEVRAKEIIFVDRDSSGVSEATY